MNVGVLVAVVTVEVEWGIAEGRSCDCDCCWRAGSVACESNGAGGVGIGGDIGPDDVEAMAELGVMEVDDIGRGEEANG